jgi:hypothetical protein
MDIHKPKPWHGVREFLKEYLIIVVGVLSALGAEQTVEVLHRHGEIEEARRALDDEVGFDLTVFDTRLALRGCMDARLDELSRWRKAFDVGPPLPLASLPPAIPGFVERTAVWRVATGTAVGQMPFSARVAYGRFYDAVAEGQDRRRRERDLWLDVARYAPARVLSQEQRLQIDSDLAQLRAINRKWDTFAEAFHRYGNGIGAKPVAVTAPAALAEERQQTAQFCAPLLPTSGGRS